MTSYAKREITTRRIEYGVESGQLVGEFHTMYGVALADYRRRTGHDGDDGWARIEARDDEIAIVFDVEYEAREADREFERLIALGEHRDAQIREVLDLVERADREGWESVLRESGDDIGQAIGRILNP